MKKLASGVGVVALLPFLLGANITLTDTPNPGNQTQKIQGSGS